MSTILIIEDEPKLVEALKLYLEGEGYKVRSAGDGEEGLLALQKTKPNLVLLDLILPKKDGFAVLQEMQKDNTLKKIPVIILSNLGEDEEIRRGIALGASDYLIKANFSIKQVSQRISKVLRETKKL